MSNPNTAATSKTRTSQHLNNRMLGHWLFRTLGSYDHRRGYHWIPNGSAKATLRHFETVLDYSEECVRSHLTTQ